MDQDKKESSKWMWFIIAVLCYGAIVSLLNGANDDDNYPTGPIPGEELSFVDTQQYDIVRADGNYTSNTCWFPDNTLFTETITVVYPDFNEENKVTGSWDPNTNTIELMQPEGLNVQIISHEVSHMVATFMSQYPDLDPHYGSYMQGYWTQCVYNIMQDDINKAQASNLN